MPNNDGLPPREFFDDTMAAQLIGRSLLVGITELDHAGNVIRRRQIFGVVTVANRRQGVCIGATNEQAEFWLPADTRAIRAAEPGQYRNRETGEVVDNPDYLTSWTFTAPPPEE